MSNENNAREYTAEECRQNFLDQVGFIFDRRMKGHGKEGQDR